MMKAFLARGFAIAAVLFVASTAPAATYYVDPQSGSDTNPGTSTAQPFRTVPGTLSRSGTSYLNSAWGSITPTNRIRPGDAIYLKGGGVQVEGPIRICGAEAPSRCTGPAFLRPGFFDSATPQAPIRIQVHPTWGSGDFTFDFSNVTALPVNGTGVLSVHTDYTWLLGDSPSRRIRLTNCDLNAYAMLTYWGRGDIASYVKGSVGRYLDVDGTDNAGDCIGVDFSHAENFLLANSTIHDLRRANEGVTVGGFNDNHTKFGMLYELASYNNNEGFASFAAKELKYLRCRAYDNDSGAGMSNRGFDGGAINGNGESNVSFFDCSAWDNGTAAFGFSGCGDSECSCGNQIRMVLVNFVGYAKNIPSRDTARCYSGVHCLLYNSLLANGTQSAFLVQSTHRRGSCSGCGTGACCSWSGNCATDGDCAAHGLSAPCDLTDTPGRTKLTARNTIFYPQGGSGLQCNGASPPGVSDNNPIDTDSDYNIYSPPAGLGDSAIMAHHTAQGGCDAAATTYASPPDWKGAHDLVGTANRPSFVSVSNSVYESNDYHLQPSSKGVDVGDWYCRVTSANGSGTTFAVDCDPNEFFYAAATYPGGIVSPDTAYLGTGGNKRCQITALATTQVGRSGSITCSQPIAWTRGEGVSRHPVFGPAPDIGPFESGLPAPVLHSVVPIP
jgi:hypothetical protein